MHPAFEKDQCLVATADCSTEFDCVRAMHGSLKSSSLDVDAHLNPSQLAMAKAVTMMIEQDLEPATLYTAWCENEGFKQYKVWDVHNRNWNVISCAGCIRRGIAISIELHYYETRTATHSAASIEKDTWWGWYLTKGILKVLCVDL